MSIRAFRIILAVLALLAGAARDRASGAASDLPGSLLCESNQAASAGYYNAEMGRPASAAKRSTALEQQPTVSQWRIDPLPSPTRARVTRYSGVTQQIESPEMWTVERDPVGIGWILFKAERPAGGSPETITITGATLHFVYSSQHVNPLYNRANIWVGQCRPSP